MEWDGLDLQGLQGLQGLAAISEVLGRPVEPRSQSANLHLWALKVEFAVRLPDRLDWLVCVPQACVPRVHEAMPLLLGRGAAGSGRLPLLLPQHAEGHEVVPLSGSPLCFGLLGVAGCATISLGHWLARSPDLLGTEAEYFGSLLFSWRLLSRKDEVGHGTKRRGVRNPSAYVYPYRAERGGKGGMLSRAARVRPPRRVGVRIAQASHWLACRRFGDAWACAPISRHTDGCKFPQPCARAPASVWELPRAVPPRRAAVLCLWPPPHDRTSPVRLGTSQPPKPKRAQGKTNL